LRRCGSLVVKGPDGTGGGVRVDGVFTADPRVVRRARNLHALSDDEMLELAAGGARVLQIRSVEFARNHGVRLHVRSTFGHAAGTWITQEDERMLEKAIISGVVTHTNRVEGVTAARLLAELADGQVNVRTILQLGEGIVFSVPSGDQAGAERTLAGLGVGRSARDDLGKVSLVVAGMRSHPGIAAALAA
jgi:aspartate kinase